jgi:hypothetical protein
MIELPTKGFFAIEVPQDVSCEGYTYNRIFIGDGEYEFHSWPYNELPPVKTDVKTSEYKFVALSDKITGRQAAKIVEVAIHMEDYERMVKDGWWNYEGGAPLKTALDSFRSLLKSLNISRAVIVKKE